MRTQLRLSFTVTPVQLSYNAHYSDPMCSWVVLARAR